MHRTYLTNACLVLPDALVQDGALLIEDGCIAALNPVAPSVENVIDLQGRLLLPGLIDLHSDAVEKDIEPRPGVVFPLDFAVATADRRNACHGITTAYHAISFAHEEFGVRNDEAAAEVVRALYRYQPHALIDNRAHCRYEVTDAKSLSVLLALIDSEQVHLLSFMDHTPGQGQYQTLEDYQNYQRRNYAKTDSQSAALAARKLSAGRGASERIAVLIDAARAHSIPLATHDDDSPARLRDMARRGVHISEFPLNVDAARAAREFGMTTIVGAPNLLRGASQNRSMRAIDALFQGDVDCLCSDYVPASLLPAVLLVPDLCDWTLPRAVRLVTANPAATVGLTDRGEIGVGKRADLIAVCRSERGPHVATTWCAGRPVLQVLDQ